jgi:hypothetical protein
LNKIEYNLLRNAILLIPYFLSINFVSGFVQMSTPPPLDFVHVVPSVQPEYLWIVIVGGIFTWCAAWGIGANDTANSWGSTVGAKAISVRNAAILAGIFEVTRSCSVSQHRNCHQSELLPLVQTLGGL